MIFRNILAKKKKNVSFSEICGGLLSSNETRPKESIFRLYQFKIATTATNRFESFWGVPSEYFRQWSFSKKIALVNFSVSQEAANYFKIECKNLFPIFCVVKVLR